VPVQSPYVFERTAGHIRNRLGDVLACEHTLGDPQNIAGHHQLRIAAKRLRYTMEICSPIYEGRLSPAIKAVKKMQTLLGDAHDCDVWIADVEAFMAAERTRTVGYFGHSRPFNRLKPGLQRLIDERRRHHQEAFGALIEHWRTLGDKGFWGQLDGVLRSPFETAAEADMETEDLSTDGQDQGIDDNRAN
jgi:CHAD domain-containing protein